MDELIEELNEISKNCEAVYAQIESGVINGLIGRLHRAAKELSKSSENSWLTRKSCLYVPEFKVAALSGSENIPWKEYSYEQVESEILQRAKVTDLKTLEIAATEATRLFKEQRLRLQGTLEAIHEFFPGSDSIQRKLESIRELTPYIPQQARINMLTPKMVVYPRGDDTERGITAPPHIRFWCYIEQESSRFGQVGELGGIARETAIFLKQRDRVQKARGSATMSTASRKIFIGHGRDQVWRELKDYLQDHLKLEIDEFNMEASAGMPIVDRLQGMLDNAKFAFLVMTAEDEQADGTMRTRENVVHEVGLFQGRLGFNKAIVVLENGCKEFSNIHGLGQIRFDRGNLQAQFHEIHRVLKREGIVP